MNKNLLYTTAAILITISFALSSCKSKKAVTKKAKLSSVENIVNKATEANNKFSSANISSATMRVKYDKTDFTFRASIRIISDSMISVSLMPALGIEIARLNLYKDKFQVIDKMNRRYAENGYNYLFLKHKIKIDYNTIEDIVTNKAFAIKTNNDYKNWNVDTKNDTTIITDNSRILNLFNIQTSLNANYQTIGVSVGNEVQQVASLNLSEFKQYKDISYPTVYELESQTAKYVYCKIHIKRVKFNETWNTPNIDLNKYRRVTINNIIP